MNRPRTIIVAAALALFAAPVEAGDRPLAVLFVDMNEDSGPAARSCTDALRARLASDDTEVTRLDAAALRRLLDPVPAGPFLAWPSSALAPAKARKDGSSFDAVVLAECRPDARTLDVLIVPAAEGRATLRLRDVAQDRRAIGWLGAAVLRRAWVGFSP